MKKIERFDKYMDFKGLNDNKVTNQLGLSKGTIGKSRGENRDLSDKVVEEILKFYTDLSRTWLLAGEGEMIKPNGNVVHVGTANGSIVSSGVNYGSVYQGQGRPTDDTEYVTAPVIPKGMYKEPNFDIYEAVHADKSIPRSPIVSQFPTYDTYYTIYTDVMMPELKPGDKLAIAPYSNDDLPNLIDGETYVIDTRSNGIMARKLFKADGGYTAVPSNPNYRTEFIPQTNVIRIFRILGLLRFFV